MTHPFEASLRTYPAAVYCETHPQEEKLDCHPCMKESVVRQEEINESFVCHLGNNADPCRMPDCAICGGAYDLEPDEDGMLAAKDDRFNPTRKW